MKRLLVLVLGLLITLGTLSTVATKAYAKTQKSQPKFHKNLKKIFKWHVTEPSKIKWRNF